MTASAASATAGNPFGPTYPRQFLRCLDTGHRWELWRVANGYRDAAGVLHRSWFRRALYCITCTAERFDVYDTQGRRVGRPSYRFPEGRKLDGYNLAELRGEARATLMASDKPSPHAPNHDPDW